MEFVGERIIVRKGPNGLSVRAMRSTGGAGFWGFWVDLWKRLTGQCVGICLTEVTVIQVPGEPGDETIDRVEVKCENVNCNCSCRPRSQARGDSSTVYWCECEK